MNTTPHTDQPSAPSPPPWPPRDPSWSAQQPPTQPRRSRLPSAAEALGWGGGLTTLVGVVAVTWDFWSTLSDGALVALLVLATAVLGVAAASVGGLDHDGDDRLAANLSGALWWMTGIAAAFTIYIGTDVVSGGRAFLALLAASLATTAMCGAAAHRTGRDSLLAGTVLSAAVAAFSLASLVPLGDPLRAASVTIVGLSAAAGLLAVSIPSRITFATTMVLLLGSVEAVLATDGRLPLVGGLLLGLIAVAVGSALRRTRGEAVTAALLAALVSAQVAYEIAPEVFNLSTTVLLAGVGMTAGCIWLVRRAGS